MGKPCSPYPPGVFPRVKEAQWRQRTSSDTRHARVSSIVSNFQSIPWIPVALIMWYGLTSRCCLGVSRQLSIYLKFLRVLFCFCILFWNYYFKNKKLAKIYFLILRFYPRRCLVLRTQKLRTPLLGAQARAIKGSLFRLSKVGSMNNYSLA